MIGMLHLVIQVEQESIPNTGIRAYCQENHVQIDVKQPDMDQMKALVLSR